MAEAPRGADEMPRGKTKAARHERGNLLCGGGGGIRTPETLSGLTVFKTAGFNHSPTPPLVILPAAASASASDL